MSETCPKCGAQENLMLGKDYTDHQVTFLCGSAFAIDADRNDPRSLYESETCLRRQLAQAQERIAALEAKNMRLRAVAERCEHPELFCPTHKTRFVEGGTGEAPLYCRECNAEALAIYSRAVAEAAKESPHA